MLRQRCEGGYNLPTVWSLHISVKNVRSVVSCDLSLNIPWCSPHTCLSRTSLFCTTGIFHSWTSSRCREAKESLFITDVLIFRMSFEWAASGGEETRFL